jgi:hypothetical protein
MSYNVRFSDVIASSGVADEISGYTATGAAEIQGDPSGLIWLSLTLVCIAIVFHAIFIVCDEHLVPAVEVLIEQYNIPGI